MERKIMLGLTLLLSGRAMTLTFIGRAGGTMPGDPPAAWLMPLIGDAVIGVSALVVAYLIFRKTGLLAWTVILIWNSVAIWDALAAFIVHTTNPWPDFFMIQLIGPAMFFGAAAMHLVIMVLAFRPEARDHFL